MAEEGAQTPGQVSGGAWFWWHCGTVTQERACRRHCRASADAYPTDTGQAPPLLSQRNLINEIGDM